MSTNFNVPTSIEETVSEIVGLKAGTRVAIRGTQAMGPAIANQVAALYELAGADENTADAMADGIRRRSDVIGEHLAIIMHELTSIGGMVGRAVQAKEEADAKRKVTAAKAGTSTSGGRTRGATNLTV